MKKKVLALGIVAAALLLCAAQCPVTDDGSDPGVPGASCDCGGPDLDCGDFASHAEAQACYESCKQRGYGDVFGLDADSDGVACESLP